MWWQRLRTALGKRGAIPDYFKKEKQPRPGVTVHGDSSCILVPRSGCPLSLRWDVTRSHTLLVLPVSEPCSTKPACWLTWIPSSNHHLAKGLNFWRWYHLTPSNCPILEGDATSHFQIALRVPSPNSSLSSARCALKLSAMFLAGSLYR